MVAGVVLSAISASVVMLIGQQNKSYMTQRTISERDRIFDALTRSLQSEANARHSLDNGTLFPSAGNGLLNRNDTLSAGNQQLSLCVHNIAIACNATGSAVSRPGITLPAPANSWIPFVLVRAVGLPSGAGAISFTRIAGTEATPVRYNVNGQICNAAVATPTCPLEAIAYARPECSTLPCIPAESLSFTVVLRHGLGSAGTPVRISGFPLQEIGPRVLNNQINMSRNLLAKRSSNSLTCPDITVGGVLTQQRLSGISATGNPICQPVQACPGGLIYQRSNADGSPVCVAQIRCASTQIFKGTSPNGQSICEDRINISCTAAETQTGIYANGSPICTFRGNSPCAPGQISTGIDWFGRPICSFKPYIRCGPGQISVGSDQSGNPICGPVASGVCYQTQGACARPFIVQSYSEVCQQAPCGKKGGCAPACAQAATCCRPNY